MSEFRDFNAMRPAVADSWHRSAAAGVTADHPYAPITPPVDELRDALARVFPLLDDVLGHAARGEADLVSTGTRPAWGADDYEMWEGLRDLLPSRSPLLALTTGQIARLDQEMGI